MKKKLFSNFYIKNKKLIPDMYYKFHISLIQRKMKGSARYCPNGYEHWCRQNLFMITCHSYPIYHINTSIKHS